MAEDIPLHPPKSWFDKPEVIPTDKRITIEPEGRVYGYIALWDTCHVGHPGCVRPPRISPSNYEYAHQGEALTSEGELVKVAVVAGGIPHAPVDMSTAAVPEYYENTGTQLMRVRYGADDNGLWFSGALWPDVSDRMVADIRASSISGDWRWHAAYRRSGGSFDFAGACFVNLPGFPMKAKGDISDRNGQPYALAASALMALDKNESFVFLTEEGTLSDCDGSCDSCTCGKQDPVVEATEEQEDEVIIAAYNLVMKKRKKQARAIKADGTEEEVEEEAPVVDENADLRQTVLEVKEAVDFLVADKLAAEIANVVVE